MLDLCKDFWGQRDGLMVRKLYLIRVYHMDRYG